MEDAREAAAFRANLEKRKYQREVNARIAGPSIAEMAQVLVFVLLGCCVVSVVDLMPLSLVVV